MKVWDLPTRLYHWTQASLFVAMAITGLTEEGPHVTVGLILFTLLVWRLMWGMVGSETSRFAQFIRSPSDVFGYLRGRYPENVGHNPAGGYMVIVMITTLLVQCITGLALAGLLDPLPGSGWWLSDEVFDLCVTIHENTINLLFGLVGVHIFAIILYKLRSKPLVMAMITGYQKNSPFKVKLASNWLALVLLLVAATLSLGIYWLSL